jgi:hypothetical protein
MTVPRVEAKSIAPVRVRQHDTKINGSALNPMLARLVLSPLLRTAAAV